jgi:hypothetical protein
LGDQQHSSADLRERSIHLSLLIGEDAKAPDFVDQILCIRLVIAFRDPQQHHHTLLDPAHNLPIDFH